MGGDLQLRQWYVTHQQRLLFAAATWLTFAVLLVAFCTWLATASVRLVLGEPALAINSTDDIDQTEPNGLLPSLLALGVLVAVEVGVYLMYKGLFTFRLPTHGNWFKRAYNHFRPVQVLVHPISGIILSGFLNVFSCPGTSSIWSLMSPECLTTEEDSCTRYNARGILLVTNVMVYGFLYGAHHVYASKHVLTFSAVPQPLSYGIRDRTIQHIIPTSLRLAIRAALWTVLVQRLVLESLCGYDVADCLAHTLGGTTHVGSAQMAGIPGEIGTIARVSTVASEMCWFGWTVLCLTFLWEFARTALETLQTKLPLAEVSNGEIIEAMGADDTPLLQCLGFKLLLRRLQQSDEGLSLFTTSTATEACPWDKASDQCLRILKRVAGNADPLGAAESFDMSVFENKFATRPLQDPALAGKGNAAVRMLVGDHGGGGTTSADATLNGWPLYTASERRSDAVGGVAHGGTAKAFRHVPLDSGGASWGARVDAMLLAVRWRLSWYHPTMSKAQALERLYSQASGSFIVHAPDSSANRNNDTIVLTITVTRNATPSAGADGPRPQARTEKQCTWSGAISYTEHSGFALVGAPRPPPPTTPGAIPVRSGELTRRTGPGARGTEGPGATMGFDTVEQLVQHYAKEPYEIDFAGDTHVLVDITDRSVIYTWPRAWLGAACTRLLGVVQSTRVMKAALDSSLDDRRRAVWTDFPCAVWALRCLARGLTNLARIQQHASGAVAMGSGLHGDTTAPADHQRRVENVVLALLRVKAAVQKHTGRYTSAGLDSVTETPDASAHRFAPARTKGQRRTAVTSVLPVEDYGFHHEIDQSLLRIVQGNPNEVSWLLERCRGDDATLVRPHADAWRALIALRRRCARS
eukprot:m.63795 g.63795  ORF g.63795 m.63795 type:complete len:866 (-) comp15853_c0_seq1:180-2777(-)